MMRVIANLSITKQQNNLSLSSSNAYYLSPCIRRRTRRCNSSTSSSPISHGSSIHPFYVLCYVAAITSNIFPRQPLVAATAAFIASSQRTVGGGQRVGGQSCFRSFTSAPSSSKPRSYDTNSRVVTTTMINASIDNITTEMLQKLTVKQLKEKIKELNLPTKTKTSHLKLKKDIVEFLYTQYNQHDQSQNQTLDDQPSLSSSDGEDNAVVEPAPKSNLTSQSQSLSASTTSNTNNNDTNRNKNSNPTSPRDIIFEHVFRRYPPLRDLKSFAQSQQEDVDESNNNEIDNHQFTSILSRNPHVLKSLSGLGELDVRQEYHPMVKSLSSSDLDIVTIGTASCVPGVTRGVSCTALRLQWRRNSNNKRDSNYNKKKTNPNSNSVNTATTGGIWIFDCGESTQLQIQRTGSIRPGKISKIFITHAHGDHSFGLPGLLCIMGQDRDRDGPPLEIYGPEGLRVWLRASIRYSVSRIVPPYRVHELMDIPMAPEWKETRFKNGRYLHELDRRNKGGSRKRSQWGTQGLAGEDSSSWISRAPMLNLEPAPQFGEISGGRDIYPTYDHPKCVDGAPIWEVEDEGDVKVYAAPMSHGVPCVGYVVNEQDKPGRLRNDLVEPIAKRNIAALKATGMRIPMKIMGTIKDLPVGGSYTFPDGTTVYQDEVVELPRKGRKIVVCGDTADSRAIASLAHGADVLIHEATNTFLSGIDKDTSMDAVMRDAKIHGHSTPSIAGNFAKHIGAKRLVLNHFSSRYKGDQSIESISIMTRIEQEAIKASGLGEDKVAAAWDFMILPVPQE